MKAKLSANVRKTGFGARAALMLGSGAFVLATLATVESTGASSHLYGTPAPPGTGPTYTTLQGNYALSPDGEAWLPIILDRENNALRYIDPLRPSMRRRDNDSRPPWYVGGSGGNFRPFFAPLYPISRGLRNDRGEGGQNDGGGGQN